MGLAVIYPSSTAPLRRHLAVFSRHDRNPPKELGSLTDSPSRNLSDNDFLFAEAGAPRGVGREERRNASRAPWFKKKKKKKKLNKSASLSL